MITDNINLLINRTLSLYKTTELKEEMNSPELTTIFINEATKTTRFITINNVNSTIELCLWRAYEKTI